MAWDPAARPLLTLSTRLPPSPSELASRTRPLTSTGTTRGKVLRELFDSDTALTPHSPRSDTSAGIDLGFGFATKFLDAKISSSGQVVIFASTMAMEGYDRDASLKVRRRFPCAFTFLPR